MACEAAEEPPLDSYFIDYDDGLPTIQPRAGIWATSPLSGCAVRRNVRVRFRPAVALLPRPVHPPELLRRPPHTPPNVAGRRQPGHSAAPANECVQLPAAGHPDRRQMLQSCAPRRHGGMLELKLSAGTDRRSARATSAATAIKSIPASAGVRPAAAGRWSTANAHLHQSSIRRVDDPLRSKGYVRVGGSCCLASQGDLDRHLLSGRPGTRAARTRADARRSCSFPIAPPQCCDSGRFQPRAVTCCPPANVTTSGVCCPGPVDPANRKECRVLIPLAACAPGYTKMPDGSAAITVLSVPTAVLQSAARPARRANSATSAAPAFRSRQRIVRRGISATAARLPAAARLPGARPDRSATAKASALRCRQPVRGAKSATATAIACQLRRELPAR